MKEGNGDSQETFGAESSDEPEPVDIERGAAETDQDISDTAQTISDSDQLLAEQDQAKSDADQDASDRDQAASDRELGRHGDSEAMQLAHATSERERSHSSEARRLSAVLRSGSMLARAENARKRDEVAGLRDTQATVRDRTAALRDEAADKYEFEFGRVGGYASKARATAAEDRARAAEDRKRAANDRKRAAEDREQALAEVEKAQMDDLTGFYRARLGHAVLQHEIDRAVRNGSQLVFFYSDIDGLKHTNDTLGHDEGDRMLVAFAEAMRTRLRSYDPVVRVGGDEFVSALPGIEIDQALQVAGEINIALGKAYAGASMSYGLSALQPGDTASSMIKRADDALRTFRAAHGS